MIRILTAAAVAALLAGPAMAQNAPGSDSRSPSQLEQQQRSLDQGGSTFGTPGNIPTDCAPNDPRPECQTAQIPEIPSPQSPDSSEPLDRSMEPSSPYSDSPSGGSSGGSGSTR